jgi:hypothetical protein
MTLLLLELQVAELVMSLPFCIAVNVMAVPTGSVSKLMDVPSEEVMVTVDDCPTVTVAVPLTVPEVAVIVTPLVVFAIALINPVVLTVTCVESLLLQLTLLTLPVVPSLKFPVAVNCWVCPTCRFGLVGVTVILLSVGLTKKPRQPDSARTKRTVPVVSNSKLRLKLKIIAKPRGQAPSARSLASNGRL